VTENQKIEIGKWGRSLRVDAAQLLPRGRTFCFYSYIHLWLRHCGECWPFHLGTLLVACGSSSQSSGPGPGIGGNWYATDPSYTPNSPNPISGVGFALADANGKLSGNVTTYLVGTQVACDSLAFKLPATGTIDGENHLNRTATNGIVSFELTSTLDSGRTTFSDGSYTVSGQEAYPTTAFTAPFEEARPSATPSSCSGSLQGQLLPTLGNYAGTLTASNAIQVDASVAIQQSATPFAGPASLPSIITQGREYIYPGGFSVSGSITLTNSVCGVTSASIQPKEGYLFGNYLVVEFDTNTTYKTGASLAFRIDPASGALILVLGDFIQEYNGSCSMPYVAGNLARQA
jgi:hypothetical protein